MSFLRALSLAGLFALGAYSIAEVPVLVKSKDTTKSGGASLMVRAFFGNVEFKGLLGGAEVSLNRRYVGKAPWTRETIEPGSWILGVKAPGYRASEFILRVEEKKDYEVIFNLEQERGFVYIDVSPPDAELSIGGQIWQAGLVELPAGLREIRARRFGYLDSTTVVSIIDRETTTLRIALKPAAFAVSAFVAARSTFNPANAGPLGQLRVSFSVSSYGSGVLDIVDENGKIVSSTSFPDFQTWHQSLVWDGRDSEGGILPDGSYELRLRTYPKGQEEGAGSALSREVQIDSSSIARPYGSGGALAGLRFFPETSAPPAGLGTLDIATGWNFAATTALVSTSGTWSGLGLIFGIEAQSLFTSADLTAADLEAGLIWPQSAIFTMDLASVDLAFAGNLALAFDAAGSSELSSEILSPLALRLPQIPDASVASFSLGLAPGLRLAWSPRKTLPSLDLELRSGLALSSSSWKLGLSASSSLVDLELSAPRWKGMEAAIEGRIVLTPSPLVLSSSLSTSLSPTGRFGDTTLEAGLGLWF